MTLYLAVLSLFKALVHKPKPDNRIESVNSISEPINDQFRIFGAEIRTCFLHYFQSEMY